MKKKKVIFISGLAALGAMAADISYADEHAADNQASLPSEEDIAESLKKLIYVPYDAGAPEVTDAGGVRAVSILPKIELLAPDRMARTLSPTPTLYWHVSKATEGPVRFTLMADDATAIDPLLEVELEGVDREGIYGVNLDDYGLILEDGGRYIWSVALSSSGDGHASDMVAQTVMEHSAAPDLALSLDDAPPDARAIRLAADGFWYDAVDTLSDQIEAEAASPWREARGRLLDQAGVLQAARYDHQRAED